MPSDYEQISLENEKKYGTDVGRFGPRLLGDLYAERAHFVFELLQNAEDALNRRGGPGGSRSVRFEVAGDCVRLSHFGVPFTEEDVRAVCGLAESTKEGDLTTIGRFGIGFKSVYAVTDRPEIHSGDEHFAVKDYVHPLPISPITLSEGETVIGLPLSEGDTADDVVRQFERLGRERTLLFLREISEIKWGVSEGPSGYCQREEVSESEGVRWVSLLSESTGQDPLEERWLVFSRAVDSNGEPAGHVELAFKLALDDSGKDAIKAVGGMPLVAFFPTGLETRLGMLVQGPYRTTSTRNDIPQNDPWNRHLVEETAALLVDALCWLRDHRMLGVHVFDALPLSRSRFHDDDRFTAMFDAVHDAIAREPLLPAYRGGYVSASQASLATEKGLLTLVSRPRLAQLLGEDGPMAWLTGDITKRRTPALYDYLIEAHDIEEIGTSGFLWRLDEEFLAGQDDKWIRRLYEFLNRQRPEHYQLYDVSLIRLEDGTHVAPGHGAPAAFLPTTEEQSSAQDTVRSAVCDSKPALAFLKSLGLSEFKRIDGIIRDVIPQYRIRGEIDESRYVADLRKSVDAYCAASPDRKRLLTDALRKAYFVRALDTGTGELSFTKPGDVYLPTKQLHALFDGVPSVLFPDRPPRGLRWQDMEALLEACGASRMLAVVEFDNLRRFTESERRQMRGKDGPLGDAKQEELTDSKFRGLKQLLEHLPSLSAEGAAARAGLLWEAMCEAAGRPGQPGFRVNYRWWYYSKRRTQRTISASVSMLKDTAWVPDESGRLHQPHQVEFASLGWKADPFLESLIKFKRPEPPSKLKALAEGAGVGLDEVEALKEAHAAGLSGEQVGRALRREARRQRTLAGNPSPAGTSTGVTIDAVGVAGGGTGRSENAGGERTSGGERVFESYIRVDRESEGTAAGRQGEHERRMGVEAAAITLILEQEPKLKRTSRNNPGYDLYETDARGVEVRWIEVKAIAGDWDSRPVTLTHTQFDCAREKGDAYWLYVVEHAGTDHSEVVKINDPAGWESSYAFDKGWRVVSIPTDATAGDSV